MTAQHGTTGGQALVATLLDSGVEVCFANPGTTEVSFVGALESLPAMRPVLCLFEGVVTGAADGYGRMTGRPAAALLHLGPGLANGIANLHNTRRAHTPVVVVVGDHARSHKLLDSPLESDIDGLARTFSSALYRTVAVDGVGRDAAAAVAAARGGPGDAHRTGTSGSVATLVVPADVGWSRGASVAAPHPPAARPAVPDAAIDETVGVLRSGQPAVLLLGSAALQEAGLRAAARIAHATGARILAEAFPARRRQGAGIPAAELLAYRAEAVADQFGEAKHLVLVGARAPVTSFAYPGSDSRLTPAGTDVHVLGDTGDHDADVEDALVRLADAVAPGVEPVVAPVDPPALPRGVLTVRNWAAVVGALLPHDAIVSDESITSGMGGLAAALAGAAPHDVLGLTGLAIGQGLPVAVGAAVACPDRPVVCLQADGSAMYTISALWTQARERLDVTTVVLSNRSYAILRAELDQLGVDAPTTAHTLMDLSDPNLDFVALAAGMGVPASRARTAEELADQFARAVSEPGPHLIEAVLATGR